MKETELTKRLRAWRDAKHMTQNEAAARLRCRSIQTYRNWETGKRTPSGPMQAAIAAIIDGEGAR